MKNIQLFLLTLFVMGITVPAGCDDTTKAFRNAHITLHLCTTSYLTALGCTVTANSYMPRKSIADRALSVMIDTLASPFFSLAHTAAEIKNGIKTESKLNIAKRAGLKSGPAIIGFGLIPMAIHQPLHERLSRKYPGLA
jgi:hypothetical protein